MLAKKNKISNGAKRIKTTTIFLAVLLATFFGHRNVGAAGGYDLKAESLIINSVKCEINQVCSFTARVKNLGGDFTLNFPLKSTVSADGYRTDSQTAISPERDAIIKTNDYLIFSIYGVFSKIGSIALNFSVDAAGYLTESDGNNNSIGLTVNVAGYDLAVDSMNIWPPNPRVNQNCYIRIAVKNNSSYNLYTETGLNLARSFQDFSISQASSTAPSFAKVIHNGDYLYYGYEGKFTGAGEKQFSFTVDSDDALKESDLANNTATKKINVYNAADTDLAIDSVSFGADKIIMGGWFDLTIGVKNTGKTSLTDATGLSKAEFNFNLPNFEYGINDLTLDNYPTLTTPFNPENIFHYKFHGAFNKPGNFDLAFVINKDKQLTESTFNNNATTTLAKVYKSLAEADDFSVIAKNVWSVSSTTAIINWRTSLKTSGVLNYNQAHYNVNDNKVEAAESAFEHAVTLNKLQPGVNYIYAITAKNGVAEKTEIISSFFLPEDDTLRVVSGPSVSVSGKNVVFSWATNLISSDRAYYKKKDTAEVSSAGIDTLAAEHKVEIKDLASGVYDYFLSSTSTPGTNAKTVWTSFEIKDVPAAVASTTVDAPNNTAAVTVATVSFSIANNGLYEKLKGKIILRVQSKGEAYYISPKEKKIYYLGRPVDAFQVIRSQGVGITNGDLEKIPVNSSSSVKSGKVSYSQALINKLKGKILLQVQSRGQAWYVNPVNGQRYFLATPADAFNLMRRLGVGVTNSDYQALGGK